jgi:fucose permease
LSSIPVSVSASRGLASYVIIYVTMLFFGLVENIKGVSFPLIKAEYGVAYSEQGGLVSLTWFGYVLFCLAASLFLQRFGSKRALLAGYALICGGILATLAAPTFWTVSLTLLVVNAGFGFFEVGANAMATVVFTARAALMMNLMHFFYGFGAVLGPKMAGVLTDALHFSWRQVYLAVMAPVCAFGLFVLATRAKGEAQASDTSQGASLTFAQALRRPLVWCFCLTLGFMEVIEFGAANWGGLYLQDVYGLDPRVTGAAFVSLFYVLFTLSRLGSGLAIERIGYMHSLMLAVLATVVLYAAGFVLGRKGIWLLPLTGLFIGIMWPTIMAVAMQVFGPDAPVATSAIITVSGAVNGIFQLVIGFTNQYAGYAWGYRSCLLYALLVLVLLRLLVQTVKRTAAAA